MILPKWFPFRKTVRRLYFTSVNKDNDRYSDYCSRYGLKPEFFVGIGSIIEGSGKVVAGENSYINHYSILKATKGKVISIGKDVRIGPYVYISTEHSNRSITKDITINDGAFVGCHSFIREGVTIGKDALIGANSVVTHDIPPHCTAYGNPAKVVTNHDIIAKELDI